MGDGRTLREVDRHADRASREALANVLLAFAYEVPNESFSGIALNLALERVE